MRSIIKPGNKTDLSDLPTSTQLLNFGSCVLTLKKLSSYPETDSHESLMGACIKPQVLPLGHYIRISVYIENKPERETYKAAFFL